MSSAIDVVLTPPESIPQTSSCLTCPAYQRAFHRDQFQQHEIQRLKAQVYYWRGQAQDYKAKYGYIQKLHFGRSAERNAEPKKKRQDVESTDTTSKTHGAHEGHVGHGRNIPFDLPQEEKTHEISPCDRHCDSCGCPYDDFPDEEVSYEVGIEIRYVLIVHKRKKYKKTCQCSHPIVTAPAPLKLFNSGLYSFDFWIQALLDKYAYGMPIERQVIRMRQEGLDVSGGALTAGILRLSPYLEPLYGLLLERIAFEPLVHADETRWRNWASLYKEERKDESTRHWLWGIFSPRYHVFVIDPSRGAKVVKDALGQGAARMIIPVIVCDRYSSYKALKTLLAFCWAHVRRDYLKLKIQYPDDTELIKWAEDWLSLIGELYALNDLRVKHVENQAVFDVYQDKIKEVLSRMETLMNAPYTKASQKAQAESMKNHWKGLTLFVDCPEIPMDNNLAERGLRGPVVGRKNFYGNHSDRACKATAIFYSILSTCKLHKVSPKKFLKRYLTTYVEWKARGSPMPSEILESFLPDEYAKRHPDDLVSE
jgi:transposase